MKTPRIPSPPPSRREQALGFAYMAFQLLFLPSLLVWANSQLSRPVSDAELNFFFYLLNFLAMLLIFPRFLGANARQAVSHPISLGQTVILGFVGYWLSTQAVTFLASQISPGFSNYNDEAITALGKSNFFLMALGTVILVPPVEECFFRGLIFRSLYGKSPWAACTLSILAFACIHILGYLGRYSALDLLIALAQYLPAGIFLAWSYVKSGSLFAPILLHAAVNALSIQALR